MGLLDDAIREHLDLKRRRGADPTEVERAEREALGPVRRTPERVPGDEPELAEAGYPPEDVEALGVAADADLEHAEEDFADERSPAAPAPHDEDERLVYETDEDDYESEEAGYEPGPRPAYDHAIEEAAAHPATSEPEPEPDSSWSFADDEPAEPASRGYADHTVEFDVEEALGEPPRESHEPAGEDPQAPDPHGPDPHGSEPPEAGEDVLEETPEFLQDTPDHDRLWFEQRPPRDFDFDK